MNLDTFPQEPTFSIQIWVLPDNPKFYIRMEMVYGLRESIDNWDTVHVPQYAVMLMAQLGEDPFDPRNVVIHSQIEDTGYEAMLNGVRAIYQDAEDYIRTWEESRSGD